MATVIAPSDVRIVPDEMVLQLHRKLVTVFYIEERMKVFTRQGKCSFHASSRGHAKLQIGISMMLRPGYDWFFSYYREKALALGLGMPIRDIFLHMLSLADDPSARGRNMPEHFSSRELHLVSMTACTGTQFLPAVGMARAVKMDGGDQVVYVSSGEGASSEGEFFEALNWAAREKLPALFVIQNNHYAISVPQDQQTASEVHRIARGFGMPTYDLDGTWFESVYQALPPLIERIRAGHGPVLVEAQVIRMDPHSSSDDHRKYRSEDELQRVRERDPLLQTERYLLKHEILTRQQLEAIHAGIEDEVKKAADEAGSCPAPDPETVMTHIYSDRSPVFEERPPVYTSNEPITMVDAINHALHEEMERDPKLLMWGEDIEDPKGGVFGVTRGLAKAFPKRVVNSPLAEASILGVAHGMAIAGYKPVVEIQFGDYSWPAFMQIRNEISSIRWRSSNQWSSPMVVRIAVGGYIKGGPFHSACIEAIYAHTPGWRILFPSAADDAKGLIKTAIRGDDPVLFLEHKGLYRRVQAKAPEPDVDYLVPFGKGRVRRTGGDATIVTWGSTVYLVLELVRQLETEGKRASLEVIDLRSIVPWDQELVFASVRKTGRILIAHEDSLTMGFGAEIAARIAEDCFDCLDAPVMRVGARDCFVPSAPALEAAVLPSVDGLRSALERLLAY
jgi:2-oxoisovalerate dehydrogenase E1 component